jgi:transcriptional regulator NrdR family protein
VLTERLACPRCASTKIKLRGKRVTKKHGIKQRYSCLECHAVFYNPSIVLVANDSAQYDKMARPRPNC